MANADENRDLEVLASKMADAGIPVLRRGGDYAPYLFAQGNGRALEISGDGYGVRWDLELWDRGSDPIPASGTEIVLYSEQEVLKVALDWLRG